MARYWVIAPYANNELYETVWNFDINNHCISIGWLAAGDISGLDKDQIVERLRQVYPDRSDRSYQAIARMMYSFYHEIEIGDVIIARKGLRVVSGVGTVIQIVTFTPDRNPVIDHPHFLGVDWSSSRRNKSFGTKKFVQSTVVEIMEEAYKQLLDEVPAAVNSDFNVGKLRFEFENQLQEFMEQHWHSIFPNFDLYEDEEGNVGLLYDTSDSGVIDILAIDRNSKDFIVIELKRRRTSDVAIGQVLRYMGWVRATLCQGDNATRRVRGIIICAEEDQKLNYAHSMVTDVEIRYYDLSFKLLDRPE